MYLRAAPPLPGLRGSERSGRGLEPVRLYPQGARDLRAGRTRPWALVINLLLVAYLVWSKRLFGVRGGKQAYEARLRTESFIEIEQAALAPDKAGSTPR
jgi:hypothetical protein